MLLGVYVLLEAEADESLGDSAAGFTDGLFVVLVGYLAWLWLSVEDL